MARTSFSQTLFTTVRSEGGLLPPDLLARVAANDAELNGLTAEDFHLGKGERVNEAAARSWDRIKAYWAAYRAATSALDQNETGVSETREQWLLPLFRELGYGRLTYRPAAEVIDDRRYAISHQAGGEPHLVPIHLVGLTQDLDRAGRQREAGGPGRTSPHGLMQEYLNRTDCLWGIVSNGLRLRVLRDNQRLSRAAYVEFDLEAMFDGGIYADFVLLYLLVHRSRLPQPGDRPERCWLERWREAAEARGARALDELRGGVETAIRALGQGLLEHPANSDLRDQLRSGNLSVLDYYRQLLRLVYRLLFLLAAEDRDLLFEERTDPRLAALYRRHYGVGRLRELVASRRHADRHDDLWRSLQRTFEALRIEATGAKLGLKPLAGGLFEGSACRDLEAALITNTRLREAIRGLTFTGSGGILRRINYRDLNVEELGSVYEGLLEMQPVLETTGERPVFTLGTSGERKSTGSYYTPDSLVQELIASALEPVIGEALARGRTPEQKRRNLLDLKVCDPACGSGHFLLAAARRIGREVARLDAGESEPDPATARHATRETIAHCIYGVDKNQLAVDLCKLALWLEAHEPGRPLGFLDHHVKWGDSLVGVFNLDALEAGIPDAAYTAVTGDDKAVARDVRKRNAEERNGQRTLFEQGETGDILGALREQLERIGSMPAETVADVEAVGAAYRKVQDRHDRADLALACHLWTWAFFAPLHRRDGWTGGLVPSTATVRRVVAQGRGGLDGRTVGKMQTDAQRVGFFHWPLEFPEVFGLEEPGFDIVLGNPPWDQVQLDPREFFSTRAPELANAANMAARTRGITKLRTTHPELAADYDIALHRMECVQKFIHGSQRFPLTSFGRINTAPLFTELSRMAVARHGRVGIIVPSGIATDSFTQQFFRDLVERGSLSSLHDFENRNGLFPGVHRSYKFALLGMVGAGLRADAVRAAFFVLDPAELRDPARTFTLTSEQIALVNPNTKTMPIFRTTRDAEITTAIYERVPVLVNEATGENPWGVRFKLMFMMNTDSHLFRTREELEAEGFVLGPDGRFRGCQADAGNREPSAGADPVSAREGQPTGEAPHGTSAGGQPLVGADLVSARGRPVDVWLPLYEAKLIHQFDHRFATYTADGATRNTTPEEHADPDYVVTPRYWVDVREVDKESRIQGEEWFLVYRTIARSTDVRTMIASLIPRSGVAGSAPLFLHIPDNRPLAAALVGSLNSVPFDFATRQKIGGTDIKFFHLKQLPVLPPEAYTPELLDQIVPCVLELTYTAHDLALFARDCGHDCPPFVWDEERRAQLRAELDGIYAHLYGLSRDDFAYILDTFPIVRRNDEKAFGEYRTKRLCLEAYDYFAPETLRALELRVRAIELALRKRINEAAKGDVESLPSPMQGKLRDTYAWHHPGFSGTPTLRELMSSTTMEDLEKLIRAEAIWPAFEPWGLSKGKFEDRLSDLHKFRNPMAHSRAMSEAVRIRGEQAVRWFEQHLGIGSGF